MSLSEKSRAALHRGLRTVIDDEEAVGQVLEHFPARDDEMPVTRAHFDERSAEVDQRFAEVDQRLDRLERRLDGLATDVELRFARMDVRFAEVERTVAEGYGAVREQAHRDVKWVAAANSGVVALATGVLGILVTLT